MTSDRGAAGTGTHCTHRAAPCAAPSQPGAGNLQAVQSHAEITTGQVISGERNQLSRKFSESWIFLELWTPREGAGMTSGQGSPWPVPAVPLQPLVPCPGDSAWAWLCVPRPAVPGKPLVPTEAQVLCCATVLPLLCHPSSFCSWPSAPVSLSAPGAPALAPSAKGRVISPSLPKGEFRDAGDAEQVGV